MENRRALPLALLLSLCLLLGCSGAETVDFRALGYERPALAALEEYTAQVEQALREEASLGTVTALLDDCYGFYDHYVTMMNLAEIRACQDTTDAFYAGELTWCRENFPLLQRGFSELYALCGSSSLAQRLESTYFWDGFVEEYGTEGERAHNEELTVLFRREEELLAQYRMGSTGPAMAELYIQLVKLRQQQAASAGFESYAQMQFSRRYHREYTPAQADAYVEAVRRELVPLYRALMAGKPDANLSGDSLSEQELLEWMAGAAGTLGGAAAEAFRFLSCYHYYDAACREQKASRSFQSYLPAVRAPFLFLDARGDTGDLFGFAHEFGHYTDAWVNGEVLGNIDASECFSQTMEFLVLDSLPLEEREKLCRWKLLDALELCVQQASFHAFEQAVYAADPETLREEDLNALFLKLAEDFGYGDETYDAAGCRWWELSHLFEAPFYVFSYLPANDVALQIYEQQLQEPGSGCDAFARMLHGPHANLQEAVASGGLESPLEPERAAAQAEFLKRKLQEWGLMAPGKKGIL